MRIIGLTGRKRSGKDTVAVMLKDGRGSGVLTLSFAEPIRRFVAECCSLTKQQLEQVKDGSVTLAADVFVSPRRMMQELGTEWGRSQHPDLWVAILRDKLDTIAERYPGTEAVLITDVRFENEADMIHDMGGVVVEVIRPTGSVAQDAHASERGLSPENVDIKLYNDGTIDQLKEQVCNTLPFLVSSLEEFQEMRQEMCCTEAANSTCFINEESDLVA